MVNKWNSGHICEYRHQNRDVMESVGDSVMARWSSVIGWLCFGKFKIKFIPMNDIGC